MEGKGVWGWKSVCVFPGKEAGRSWLLLRTRGSVAPLPTSSSPLLQFLLPTTFIIRLWDKGDKKNYNSHGVWGRQALDG